MLYGYVTSTIDFMAREGKVKKHESMDCTYRSLSSGMEGREKRKMRLLTFLEAGKHVEDTVERAKGGTPFP